MAALRKEAAKWQEMEESKVFLETQVAQFRSAKQQEAIRADGFAAQVTHQPDPPPCCYERHLLTCAHMNNEVFPATTA